METEAATSMAGAKRKPESQDILIDGKNIYHPFPTSKSPSSVWKAFRLDRDLDYRESNQVFCMKCVKKAANETTVIHSEQWKRGGAKF